MASFAWHRIALLACPLAVAGCANHIHEVDTVPGSGEGFFDAAKARVISVDAKQRAVITAERPISKEELTADGTKKRVFVTTYRAFCTEPSPDVFSVLSQALSASGSAQKDAATVSAALQAAFSSTESGSTIPRTQTINMLRELMYRTCERYISGALDELQFPIQAVRDQHLMVSILAIEQLTGAVTPPTITLTGTASGNAGQPTSEAIVRLDDAWKALQKADAAQKAAQSDYDKLEGKDPKCSKLKADVDAGKPPAADSDDAKKQQDCTSAQSKLTQAQKDRQGAAEHHDSLKTAVAKGGSASVATGGQASVTAGQRPDPQSVGAIAAAVSKIVDQNFQQDEFLLFCIRVMNDAGSQAITGVCKDYVQKSVQNRAAQLEADTARLRASIGEANKANFDKFWPKVRKDDTSADPAKLQAAVKKVIAEQQPVASWRRRLEAMGAMTKKADIEEAFNSLDDELQKALAK